MIQLRSIRDHPVAARSVLDALHMLLALRSNARLAAVDIAQSIR